jgi:hypothetical protein
VQDSPLLRDVAVGLITNIWQPEIGPGVDYLRDSLYQALYPLILWCGDIDQMHGMGGRLDFLRQKIRRGADGQQCKREFMVAFPGHAGYVLANDDAIFNFWNLAGYDLDAVWTRPYEESSNVEYIDPNLAWRTSGAGAKMAAVDAHMRPRFKAMQIANLKGPRRHMSSVIDVI